MVGSVKLPYFCDSDVSDVQGHLRSLILVPIGNRIRAFLLGRHSNLGHILHRFGDIAGFWWSWPHAYSILFLGCSRCTRSPTFGSARA